VLGRSHSLSGSLAWASLAATAPLVGVHPHGPAVAAGLLSTAGAALLPDLDHPEATISFTFGFATHALTRFVHRVSGGHRHATHSLAFAAGAGLAAALGNLLGGRWFDLPLLFALFAFGLRALHLARGMAPALALALTVVVAVAMPHDLGWLPWSVGVGTLAHLAGDCLTREGCPLLWPRRRHWMIPVIRRTGNRVETWLFAPLFAAGTVMVLAYGR
jgi:membrane-bound metal-dependent hydrolase YbcI (DUF457 family)